jgi:surfeit locus 1 family protein
VQGRSPWSYFLPETRGHLLTTAGQTHAPQKWRRLLAPGIAAFITFWLLIALGVWQLHRLSWKEGILAAIHQAEIAPPVPLPANPTPFEKVSIAGTWVPDKAAMYGDEVHDSPSGPISGGELIVALRRPAGEIVLVDLGWVPERKPAPLPEPPGPTQASGYLHAAISPGWFAGTDDPAHGLYYTLDPAKIGDGMGLQNVAPYILIAMGPLPPPGNHAPQPAQHLPTPPNNHYEYALTWFGFALVLAFEFFFFARKRLLD